MRLPLVLPPLVGISYVKFIKNGGQSKKNGIFYTTINDRWGQNKRAVICRLS